MGPLFETIRSRLLVGLAVLMAGLLGTVALGAATLRLMQQAVATELAALQAKCFASRAQHQNGIELL